MTYLVYVHVASITKIRALVLTIHSSTGIVWVSGEDVLFPLPSGASNGKVHLWTINSSNADLSEQARANHTPMPLNIVHLSELRSDSQCRVTAMDFSKEEALLGVGYEDGTVRVWDLQVCVEEQ